MRTRDFSNLQHALNRRPVVLKGPLATWKPLDLGSHNILGFWHNFRPCLAGSLNLCESLPAFKGADKVRLLEDLCWSEMTRFFVLAFFSHVFSLGLGRFREFPLAGHIGSSTYDHFRKGTTIHESISVGHSGDVPRCKGLTHQLWNQKKSSTNLQKDSLSIGNFRIDMNFSFSRLILEKLPSIFFGTIFRAPSPPIFSPMFSLCLWCSGRPLLAAP